jgi:diaminohydroxyphosphoribosylaminopyrimidine deaminase/5-amino-6-(5-phosphoribosylamino)uracil reductase
VSLKDDFQYMADALDLAKAQAGKTGKNPAVGCVILSAEGRKIAQGVTGIGGAEHAEQAALASLAKGAAQQGTAYVTLEPCRERSAGGVSCSALLLDAGITRLVCAIADQHPNGAGGFSRLVQAGVTVEVGLMKEEAAELYRAFFNTI